METLEYSPDGRTVAIAKGYGEVVFFDAATGKKMEQLDTGLPDFLGKLSFSPDGKLLAAACTRPRDEVVVLDVSAITNAPKNKTGDKK